MLARLKGGRLKHFYRLTSIRCYCLLFSLFDSFFVLLYTLSLLLLLYCLLLPRNLLLLRTILTIHWPSLDIYHVALMHFFFLYMLQHRRLFHLVVYLSINVHDLRILLLLRFLYFYNRRASLLFLLHQPLISHILFFFDILK